MGQVVVLKMILAIEQDALEYFLSRQNVKQDLGRLLPHIHNAFPDAVPCPPNQVILNDLHYQITLNSKGVILKYVESPVNKPVKEHHSRHAAIVRAVYGISETLNIAPRHGGYLIPLPEKCADALRWEKRKLQCDVLTAILPEFFPDFRVVPQNSPKLAFESGGILYRSGFTAEGIEISVSRNDPAYTFDTPIGVFDTLEEGLRATMVMLGKGTGFLGIYINPQNGCPKRHYAAFEKDGVYYRGVRNGKSYGVQKVDAFARSFLSAHGSLYMALNYDMDAKLPPQELEAIFNQNRKHGRVLPIGSCPSMKGEKL